MKNLSIIALLISIYSLIKVLMPDLSNINAESTALTGIILISAYLFALTIKRVKLPLLTGYMLMGLILGPSVLNILNSDLLEQLRFLENLALAFIAVTAGGELKFQRIKKFLRTVVYLLSGQIIFVFAGLFLFLVFFSEQIPFLSDLETRLIFGFSILFAATAISKSPATTIGIITELRAKGKITDLVLSVTVLKSILLIIAFPVCIAWAKIYLIEGTVFNISLIKNTLFQIFGSIMVGAAIGFLIIGYLKNVKMERSLFLLGTAIIIVEFNNLLNVEILLTSIIAGVVVENFSSQGEALIKGIEKSSLPLYIIFFSFAGAGLHVDTLKNTIVLTSLLVIIRMFMIFVGNYVGAFLSGEDSFVKRVSWMGFIGQAGIAVGLATVIEKAIPGPVGLQFKTILIASVVINELLGPIFFKYILVRSGESNAKI